MYGLGKLVGEAMDHIPYLNEWLPQAVNYVSGIDVKENLDGLVGLMGLVPGLKHSGTKISKDDGSLEEVTLSPVTVNFNPK